MKDTSGALNSLPDSSLSETTRWAFFAGFAFPLLFAAEGFLGDAAGFLVLLAFSGSARFEGMAALAEPFPDALSFCFLGEGFAGSS